jgi:hypothetical protein
VGDGRLFFLILPKNRFGLLLLFPAAAGLSKLLDAVRNHGMPILQDVIEALSSVSKDDTWCDFIDDPMSDPGDFNTSKDGDATSFSSGACWSLLLPLFSKRLAFLGFDLDDNDRMNGMVAEGAWPQRAVWYTVASD